MLYDGTSEITFSVLVCSLETKRSLLRKLQDARYHTQVHTKSDRSPGSDHRECGESPITRHKYGVIVRFFFFCFASLAGENKCAKDDERRDPALSAQLGWPRRIVGLSTKGGV